MTGESGQNWLNVVGNYPIPGSVQDPSQSDAPLAAMRPSTFTVLSRMLNPIKVIPTPGELSRDWRGLAELGGLDSESISFLQTKDDPTGELIRIWCRSENAGCQLISDLTAFLGVIDRYDVVDDITPLLEEDAIGYNDKTKNAQGGREVTSFNSAIEGNIITIEDSERLHKGLPLTRYDAFLLHAEEDSEFAEEVVKRLENEYGLKLCLKDRDLLPGIMFEHEVIGRLIEERCNRFLAIFSPSFLKSPANQFLLSYAQASALESRVRKIVPCIYQKCELPPSVRYSFCIVYNRSGKLWNFWEKLSQSVRSLPSTSVVKRSDIASIKDSDLKSSFEDKSSIETVSWLDTVDPLKSNPVSKSSHSKSETDSGYSFVPDPETLSISSNALLVSPGNAKTSSKTSKWYKKIPKFGQKKKEKNRVHHAMAE